MEAFAYAALALALTSVLALTLLVARRLVLAWGERRRIVALERLRPVALAIVDGEPIPVEERAHAEEQAELLAELLARYARQLRGDARQRIGEFFETSGAVERELRRLRSRRRRRRTAAAYALGDMAARPACAELLRVLEGDRDREVRAAVARSLGRIGSPEAVPALIEALVQRRVAQAVAGQALIEIGPSAVPRLLALLGQDEPAIRAWAAELVGLVGDAGDAPLLLGCLQDTSAAVRERAARALGRLGADEAAGLLRETLSDRVPAVRAAAAYALGRLLDREAVEPLLAQARAGEFEPARAAAEAVARIDPERARASAAEPGAGPHLREAADLLAL